MRHHGLRRLSLPISQARHEAVVDPRQGLPVIMLAARSLSSRPLGQARHELSTVVDRWTPQQGFIRAWGGWANSTLALAQLQSSISFTVPSFKARAAILFEEVGRRVQGMWAWLSHVTRPLRGCRSGLPSPERTRSPSPTW